MNRNDILQDIYMNEKIEYFSQTVKLNTDNLIKKIETDMINYRENYLSEQISLLENEINEYYNKNISETDNDIKIKLSKIKIDTKHEYLRIRDDLQNKLFNELQSKLIQFVNSSDYINFLYRSCDRCIGMFGKSSHVKILISAADNNKTQLLSDYIGDRIDSTFEISEKIKFGGLYYHNTEKNIVLNETIDERLQFEKSIFSQ